MSSPNKGYTRELQFELRCRELGYSIVCRPSREDRGVDFVIFTDKGWVGVQVKSARPNYSNSVMRVKFSNDRNSRRGRKYYAACGVSVFAVCLESSVYLFPIGAVSESGIFFPRTSGFREAWIAVLGAPVGSEPIKRAEEIAQLNTLFEKTT